jgi:hypothetical protein
MGPIGPQSGPDSGVLSFGDRHFLIPVKPGRTQTKYTVDAQMGGRRCAIGTDTGASVETAGRGAKYPLIFVGKISAFGRQFMSAFQAYGGSYEHDGRRFSWRCYATARVYEVRLSEHLPAAPPPKGQKWIRRSRHKGDAEFGWLIDASAVDFSHILLQVEPARWPERRGEERQSAAAY